MTRRAVRDNVDGGNAALIDLVEMGGGKYVCIWNLGGWFYKLSIYDDATQSQEEVGKTCASLEEAKAVAEAIAAGEPIGDSARISDGFADYEGNDLDYERMFDRAYDAYDALLDKGAEVVGWRDVANEMGIQLNTLNGDDYELLKSAIEDALIQWDYDNTELNSMYPIYEGMEQYNLPRKGSGMYYSGPVKLSPLSRETVYVDGIPKTQDSRASRPISSKMVKDDADDIQVGDKVKTDHDDRTHEVVDVRSKQGRSEYMLGDTSGWWSAWQLTKVSDSRKIKDSENELYELVEDILQRDVLEKNYRKHPFTLYRQLPNGGIELETYKDTLKRRGVDYVKHLIKDWTGIDVEVKVGDEHSILGGETKVTLEVYSKATTDISDSKKIKDDDGGVLDGKLMIAFKEGAADDMISKLKEHENETGEIDGAQYEIYGVESQDGVAAVDMCSTTSEPNDFVKTLLKNWGIESVDGAEFKASEEMKELQQNQEEVSDSKKVEDDDDAFDEYFDYSKESIEQGKKVNDKCGGKRKVKDSDGIDELNEDWEDEDPGYEYEESDSEEFNKGDAGHYVATEPDKVEDSKISDGYGGDCDSLSNVNNTEIFRDNKKGGAFIWLNGKRKYFSNKDAAIAYVEKNFEENGMPKKK